eukprot:984360-Karenia_brevis.AAC.1
MHDDWDDLPCGHASSVVWDMAVQPCWKKADLYLPKEKADRASEYRLVRDEVWRPAEKAVGKWPP